MISTITIDDGGASSSSGDDNARVRQSTQLAAWLERYTDKLDGAFHYCDQESVHGGSDTSVPSLVRKSPSSSLASDSEDAMSAEGGDDNVDSEPAVTNDDLVVAGAVGDSDSGSGEPDQKKRRSMAHALTQLIWRTVMRINPPTEESEGDNEDGNGEGEGQEGDYEVTTAATAGAGAGAGAGAAAAAATSDHHDDSDDGASDGGANHQFVVDFDGDELSAPMYMAPSGFTWKNVDNSASAAEIVLNNENNTRARWFLRWIVEAADSSTTEMTKRINGASDSPTSAMLMLVCIIKAMKEWIDAAVYSSVMDEYNHGVAHFVEGKVSNSVTASTSANGSSDAGASAGSSPSKMTSGSSQGKFDDLAHVHLVIEAMRGYLTHCVGHQLLTDAVKLLSAVLRGFARPTLQDRAFETGEYSYNYFGARRSCPRAPGPLSAYLLSDEGETVLGLFLGESTKPLNLLSCDLAHLLVKSRLLMEIVGARSHKSATASSDMGLGYTGVASGNTDDSEGVLQIVCVAAFWQSVLAECCAAVVLATQAGTHSSGEIPAERLAAESLVYRRCLVYTREIVDKFVHEGLFSPSTLPDPTSMRWRVMTDNILFRWCATVRALLQINLRLFGSGAAGAVDAEPTGGTDGLRQDGSLGGISWETLWQLQKYHIGGYNITGFGDGSTRGRAAGVAALGLTGLSRDYCRYVPNDTLTTDGNLHFFPQTIHMHIGLLEHIKACRLECLLTVGPSEDWQNQFLDRAVGSYKKLLHPYNKLKSTMHQWGPILSPISLISLPEYYDQLHQGVVQLLHDAAEESAEIAAAAVDMPALCLLCGAVLNAGGKGRCYNHSMYNCSLPGDSGIFFLVQVSSCDSRVV
jgi:hypothetical protein